MNILITGDLGFVGTETKKLIADTRPEYTVFGYDIMNGHDIGDEEQLDSFIKEKKIDRILHLAAIARFDEADKDPKRCYETNIMGTNNVSFMSDKYGIPIVYASTGSVYMPIKEEPPITEEFPGKGNSVYGCSKYVGEMYIRETSMPWIILRYAHLYGKEKRHHGLIGGFLKRINFGMEPVLYGGAQSNDFCYIKDIAKANLLALEASFDKCNQVYNIGTGEELSAEEAGQIICDMAGYKGKIQKKEGRTVDPSRFVYDISKAENMLGFKAEYNFKKGLKDMFA